jgi:phosphomannomutase
MKRGFSERVNVCFGKSDVRCIAGKELDEEIAYRTGKAFVDLLKAKEIYVGRDMRVSSDSLKKSFVKGAREQGARVIDVGLVDSPSLYFLSGKFKKPSAMITASHNPKEYNGIKLSDVGAIPIGEKTGLKKIRELVLNNNFRRVKIKGNYTTKDISREYRRHVLKFIDVKKLKGLSVVVDGGSGMAGRIFPLVSKGLGIKVKPLDFMLDGRFPVHNPNPALKKNAKHIMDEVKKGKADFGIAFDGDMDRVFFVDEEGRLIDSSFIGALIASRLVRKGNKVVYNVACSKIIPEIVKTLGGKSFKEKVGHGFIKPRMRKEKAIFGAEHSAHYFYKDNYYADSGMISAMIVCEIFSEVKSRGWKFSDLVRGFNRYSKSEEKSFRVGDVDEVISRVRKKYGKRARKIEKIDGLTFDFGDWWFNVRGSNTEPLIRINLEARDKKTMREKLKEVIKIVRK